MEMLESFRKWQRENPEWELICDIADSEALYAGWSELPKPERMSWIGKCREGAREMWEEFGIKRCKVPVMVLSDKLVLHELTDWPHGEAMTVFKTGGLINERPRKDRNEKAA